MSERTKSAGETTDAVANALAGAAFRALTTDPQMGVGVITLSGKIAYLNDQAARIFHGAEARAAQYVGRTWSDHMPPEWVRERLEVLGRVNLTGKPALMRTVWRDFQHFTWITLIDREPEATDRFSVEDDPEPIFLTITRRIGGDEEAERLVPKDEHDEVESGVVRLKKLNRLSDRELEVLSLLGQGLSVKETAKILFRAEKTIERHRDSIHAKLEVSDRAELVKVAVRAGLTLADAEKSRV